MPLQDIVNDFLNYAAFHLYTFVITNLRLIFNVPPWWLIGANEADYYLSIVLDHNNWEGDNICVPRCRLARAITCGTRGGCGCFHCQDVFYNRRPTVEEEAAYGAANESSDEESSDVESDSATNTERAESGIDVDSTDSYDEGNHFWDHL
jgi:hypothetical protein